MSEALISVLQWLIPSGGLGAALIWLTNKTLRNLRTAKEVHDTYKVMYENVQVTLVEIQNEKREMFKRMSWYERAINRCYSCKYDAVCPAIFELQKHKGELRVAAEGFAPIQRKNHRRARDNPNESGSTSDSDERPP